MGYIHLRLPATLALFGVLIACTTSLRAQVLYTDSSTFLSNVAPGYYDESFDSLGANRSLGASKTFSSNGFSYTASDTYGLFTVPLGGSDVGLSTIRASDAITLNFTSGNVTAVGGNFFTTAANGSPSLSAITLTFSDGVTEMVVPGIGSTMPFFGLTSDPSTTITSMTIQSDGLRNHFATINNLIVGSLSSVPEPGVITLFAAFAVSGVVLIRRRRASAMRCSAEAVLIPAEALSLT